LTKSNVELVMRGGRSRWHIENQTFNTLKNQDYEFEHNFGHGKQYLATVLAMLMMLAFLIDQVQEYGLCFFPGGPAAVSFTNFIVDENQRTFYRILY